MVSEVSPVNFAKFVTQLDAFDSKSQSINYARLWLWLVAFYYLHPVFALLFADSSEHSFNPSFKVLPLLYKQLQPFSLIHLPVRGVGSLEGSSSNKTWCVAFFFMAHETHLSLWCVLIISLWTETHRETREPQKVSWALHKKTRSETRSHSFKQTHNHKKSHHRKEPECNTRNGITRLW